MMISAQRILSSTRIIEHPATIQFKTRVAQPDRVVLPTCDGIVYLRQSDIRYCKAEGSYCQIITKNGKSLLIAKTLKWVEKRLSNHAFCRVHASYLVAISGISALTRDSIEMDDHQSIPVARSRKQHVKLTLASYYGY